MKTGKKISRILFAVAFAALVLTESKSYSQTDFIRYSIDNYPTGGRPCEEIGHAIMDRFTNITGKIVGTYTCDRPRRGLTNINLFYVSDERLRLESTWQARMMPEGTYRSERDCWDDLETRVGQFRRATRLEPVVAYCFREAYADTSDHPVVLRIDAFGDGAKKYYSQDIPFGVAPQILDQSFFDGIAKGLQEVGADVAAIFLRNDPFGVAKLSLNYYDDLPVNLRFSGSAFYDDNQACESQRVAAVTSSESVGQNILSSACVIKEFGTWQMTLVHFFNPDVQLQEFPTIFDDLASCNGMVDDTLSFARQQYGWDVRRGYCAGMDEEWRIHAYRQMNQTESKK